MNDDCGLDELPAPMTPDRRPAARRARTGRRTPSSPARTACAASAPRSSAGDLPDVARPAGAPTPRAGGAAAALVVVATGGTLPSGRVHAPVAGRSRRRARSRRRRGQRRRRGPPRPPRCPSTSRRCRTSASCCCGSSAAAPRHGGRREGRAGRDDRTQRLPARRRGHPGLHPRRVDPGARARHATPRSPSTCPAPPSPRLPPSRQDAEAAAPAAGLDGDRGSRRGGARRAAAADGQHHRGSEPTPLLFGLAPARPAADPDRGPRPPSAECGSTRPEAQASARGHPQRRRRRHEPRRAPGAGRCSATTARLDPGHRRLPAAHRRPGEAAGSAGEGPAGPVVDLRLADHAARHLHAGGPRARRRPGAPVSRT